MDASSQHAPPHLRRKAAAIERWLISRVAELAQQNESDIDISLPFSRYALDSAAAAELTADLEDWIDIDLPATVMWDYPTIESLTRYLVTAVKRT